MSADHSTSVNLAGVSNDGKIAAYEVRLGGADETTVRLIDTDSHKELPDQLPKGVYFGVSIEPGDHRGVYYSRATSGGPRLYHHVMGSDSATDKILFGEDYKNDKIVASQLSEDGHYLTITVIFGSGSTRSEIYVKNLQDDSPIKPIQNDLDALFFGEVEDGVLYLRTNWNAPHWSVYRVDLDHPARDQWKQIVPETDATIDDMELSGGKKVFVKYVQNAVSHLKIFDTDGTPSGELSLPATGTIESVAARWGSPEVFLSFNSFSIPSNIYHYDLRKNQLDVWSAPKVPVDTANYVTDQVWYASKDGTKVPMFLFYKKGLAKTGTNPALLTGYGGFDVSSTPEYRPEAIAWADRGGIYALANLRGGAEFGEAWHHAGMMEKKQNVFDDFIAAAEWLIDNKYTDKDHLAIQGGSNGGLLVGAAETQRPGLFHAVVCVYPLLDMLRFQMFEDGPYWVPEYGSSENADQFKYLLAYSPYQNVKDGTKYPATLFITGDGDTRVAPLHARKMAARLQAATSSDAPILLLYDTKSGHSGGRPLNKQIEEDTDILSFLSTQVGASK
jgi:prolyl oligopeptidase